MQQGEIFLNPGYVSSVKIHVRWVLAGSQLPANDHSDTSMQWPSENHFYNDLSSGPLYGPLASPSTPL